MNPNFSSVLSNDQIREILVKRIDQQKQSIGIVAGIIEPAGESANRRVVAHGNLAQGDPRPLDADTLFEIGSLTKVFTSLVLADMVDRKEVALDHPAAQYLPDHVKLPQRNGTSITLRHLSMHTSGLPRVPGNLKPKNPLNPYADYSVENLYQFLSTYELPRDPGSEVEYSNLGAGLLGHILARRAGLDYESLIQSRITQPLGMADTAIALSASQKQRLATGHNSALVPAAPWDLPTLAGAGALRSTARDMLTLLEAFLGVRQAPLAPAMKAMLDVRHPVGKTKFEVGLAWMVLGDLVWHDGGTGGFCCWAGFDPQRRIGAVVLSNAFTLTGVADIGMHLVNPKFPLGQPEPPPQRPEIALDPELLDRYTGRYQLAPDRLLEITRDGGHLFVQVSTPAVTGPKFELGAESEKVFFGKMTGSQLTFETGPGGRATSVTMQRTGREPTSAPRLP